MDIAKNALGRRENRRSALPAPAERYLASAVRPRPCDVTSPLADVLARHSDYFDLFLDFRGYVDHSLLDDLVAKDYASVKFLTAFDDFGVPRCQPRALPSTAPA